LLARKMQLAIEVLTHAVEIDGLAFDLRSTLVRTLVRTGAVDAAADHYRLYARLMERDLGVRAPPFESLVAEGDLNAE
jgi:hypothetical protein